MRGIAVIGVVALGVAGIACSSAGSGAACVPGEAHDCTCMGGIPSAQVCLASGTGYGPCVCDGPDASGAGTASDASVSGGDSEGPTPDGLESGDTAGDAAAPSDDGTDGATTGDGSGVDDTGAALDDDVPTGDAVAPDVTDQETAEIDAPDGAAPVDGVIAPKCATAFAEVAGPTVVSPGIAVSLTAEKSASPNGAVVAWQWEVTAPAGGEGAFVPSAAVPNPTFVPAVSGDYTFSLTVTDEIGVTSCTPGQSTISVSEGRHIYVEVTWHTPGDPNELDLGPDAGADVDLHFAHLAYAQDQPDLDGDGSPDPWFSQPFDCFWFNPQPNWGHADPKAGDDPDLVIDDSDGAGPEAMDLGHAEPFWYGVAVHYWNDHLFGPSFATVRIYIDDVLKVTYPSVELVGQDMWNVARIHGVTGEIVAVTAADGSPQITPGYQNPHFFQP